MQIKKNSWFVVVNPMAGAGKTKALWNKIKTGLESADLVFEHALSEYAGHEAVLSRDAVLGGYTQIISVGGDGTIQKVVNGLYSQKKILYCPFLSFYIIKLISFTKYGGSYSYMC